MRAARDAAPAAARNGVLLVGKSLGSRVALGVAADLEGVIGVVAFGYPVSGKDEGRRRLVREAEVPVLLLQGDRDRVADIKDIRKLEKDEAFTESLEVYEVAAGDHSLVKTKKWLRDNEMTQEEVDVDIANVVSLWLKNVTEAGGVKRQK